MNIGIDANCLVFDRSGFGRYTYNLVKNLLMIDTQNHYFLYASFIRHRKNRLKLLEALVDETKSRNVTIRILPLPAQWKEIMIGTNYPYSDLIRDPLDLFYAPHFAGIAKRGFARQVVTIHDLVFMHFPEHRGVKLSRYYLNRTKVALENSNHIIAVSESTKKDLIKLLGVEEEKITVTSEGADNQFKLITDQKEILSHTKAYIDPKFKYILSVGTLEPRKNLSAVLKAFSQLPVKLRQEYKLVFVGAKGWNNQEFEKTVEDYNLTDHIILTGFVADEDLPYIYNRASVFVYPSLYEGFGLPVLEAMSCGVPVVTSNISSLPEVVDDAGKTVDPHDDKEIAENIKLILTNPKLAQSLREKGLKRALKFSWKKVALETLKVFDETVKNDGK